MKLRIKLLLAAGVMMATVVLPACSHKNPLLSEDIISKMKSQFFFDDDKNFPIRECSRYYAGDGSESSKTKCDQWTADYYKTLLNNGSIPSTTTLEDFRDQAFWKAVEPK